MSGSAATAKRAALYARVSTGDQAPETQLGELRRYVERRGWVVAAEHVDRAVSGSKDRRPALDRLMTAVRRREVDAVVVWKFDRFARSVRHLVSALEEFRAVGVDFVSTTEVVDTSTPMGAMIFTVVAAMAEFERELIRERVRAGLRRARREGRRIGRPPVPVNVAAARRRLADGASVTGVARELRVSRRTLRRALARAAAGEAAGSGVDAEGGEAGPEAGEDDGDVGLGETPPGSAA